MLCVCAILVLSLCFVLFQFDLVFYLSFRFLKREKGVELDMWGGMEDLGRHYRRGGKTIIIIYYMEKIILKKKQKKGRLPKLYGELCHKSQWLRIQFRDWVLPGTHKPGFSPILHKEQQPGINNVMIFSTLIQSNHHQFYFLCC